MSPPDPRHEPAAALLDSARRWLVPVRTALGADFVSAALTGGVLTSGFDPKHSHVNVIVVARALAPATLEGLVASLPRGDKPPFFDPLFVTRDEVAESTDVFAIEWLDVRERHLLLEGEDVFSGLAIAPEALRLQIEHELRSKHLRLRMQWLAHASRPADLRKSIVQQASGYHALFRALLRLRGEAAPASHEAVIDRVAEVHGLDAAALRGPHELRYPVARLDDAAAKERYRRFLVEIERLVSAVDHTLAR